MQILLVGITAAIGSLAIFCAGLYIGYRARQQNEPTLMVPEGFKLVSRDQVDYEQKNVKRTIEPTGEVKTTRDYELLRQQSGPVQPRKRSQVILEEQREAEAKRVRELVQ